MSYLIAVVGPTAAGKSALALHLALKFNGEIVSADSRQVYRYMDIGTAKPLLEERSLASHRLIDILNPDQEFSLALFLKLAHEAVGDIWDQRRLPILAGGTGQYAQAFLEGWQVPSIPPSPQLRAELESRAQREGKEALYDELLKVDSEAAARIDPRNLRRVIRALEVHYNTRVPPAVSRSKQPPPYRMLIIGLTTDRGELYRRIDQRVDEMIQRGLVEEVQALLNRGYSAALPSMSSLGYREIALHLQGQLSLAEATQLIKHKSHRFARHQYAWFRLRDPRINWLTTGNEVIEQAEALVREFLREGSSCDTIAAISRERMP